MANETTQSLTSAALDLDAKWREEKKEFARQIMAQAKVFMEHDNAVIGHFATITAALAKYAQQHPERVFSDAGASAEGLKPGDISGGNFGQDLFDFIKDIITRDKDFFLNLIGHIFGL